ncbi:disease resistance protein RGA2-like [Carex rostrata]
MNLSIANWAVSTIATSVIHNLVSAAYLYLRDRMLPADNEAELKKLQTALPQITAVMGIVEALKMKHPDASQWVEQFRQALEASEDVLDELEYKKLEDMVKDKDEVGGSASNSKKKKLSVLNGDTLERLKDAVSMLDRVVDGLQPLLQAATMLGIHGLSESWQGASEVLRRETTSFLAKREVFGRDAEKDEIISWLKRPTHARLSSFGIVGVGGLGKTTLVQFAYQEMRGSNHFDKTIWICVSINFSVEDITRKMLSELGESSSGDKPLNALQETLNQNILSKKVLLVLDDVWNDDRMWDWEQLIAPLRFVQQGSKILFTTRMKSVAHLLAGVINTEQQSLALQGLGEQELRLLFYSYAFQGFNPDNHRDFQVIGDQILKMLRGNPLAAKVIGSLLHSRMDPQYWRRILNHGALFKLEEAKDVLDVLKLSYYHLPANLQECFRFCSIFPQDHKFNKDELIKMWMAVGIIRQQLGQDKQLEDIGQDYFHHLLRKSFFEYTIKSWNGEERYVMHDMVHEMALNVSYGECCRIESNDKSIIIPSTIRHVSVHKSEIDKVSHLENLRSLVIFPYLNTNSLILSNNLIKKPLRLLKIDQYCIFESPEEISCLVHLRYLSIRLSHASQPLMDSLLASIFKLYHLQVLEFSTVGDNSGFKTTRITNLVRLRYMRLPKEIMQTIHGVHKLTSLKELTFLVSQESGRRINELGTLKNLCHLFIENIENVRDPTEAKSANLLGKNNLMSLSLKWTSGSNPVNPEQIINYLQPDPNLKELTIENYEGKRSPRWMEESSLLNLSSLKLFSCPMWKNQLFYGQMSYLKILDIRHCVSLDRLPDMPLSLIEFRINNVGLTCLPNMNLSCDNNTPTPSSLKSSLSVVQISRCPNLKSLDGFLQQHNLDLQAIKTLEINRCEKLVFVPVGAFGRFVSLTELTIRDCPMLAAVDNLNNLLPTKLKEILIKNCGELDVPLLESASCLTTLTFIWIENCANISHIPSENAFRSVTELCIHGCKKLIEHSSSKQAHGVNQGSNLVCLKLSYLEIDHLSLILIEPLRSLISVRILKVSYCLGMETLPEQWFLQNSSTLEHLIILNASSLRSLPTTMARLTALERLEIADADLLEELPELPVSLRELFISYAKSLKSLPTAMARLTALKYLTIQKADLLEELPELPASLKVKDIEGRGGRLL